jgi:hypothetical protein
MALFAFGCGAQNAVTSTAVASATAHYENPTFGFGFDYPKAWKLTAAPGTSATRLIVLAGEDGPTYMGSDWVWVAVAVFDRSEGEAFTDSKDAAQIATAMEKSDEGPTLQQPASLTVSGHPAVWAVHEETYEGKPAIQTQLYVVTDTYLFTVSGEAPKGEWERYKSVLEAFVSSFRVTAP